MPKSQAHGVQQSSGTRPGTAASSRVCDQLRRAAERARQLIFLMLMDILLTHGYFLYEDPKELQIMKPYPPLGILYICAHLRRKGMQVQVFDSTFSSRQQLFDLIRKGPPSVIGMYANLM